MSVEKLPVAVIGAGPIGLAAAAHLLARGETPIVFEAASEVAGSIRNWAHVRLFSPWQYLVDKESVALLAETGWEMPPEAYLPTGGELVRDYIAPLAATPALKPYIKLNALVTGVSRRRIDKMKDTGRNAAPFVLQVEIEGEPQRVLARAVIDASGTWENPNPLGSDGLTAPGERRFRQRIFYGIPDIRGQHRRRYAGKRVAVVGGGHSAINALLELGDILPSYPQMVVHWILRKPNVAAAYGGLGSDALPGRGMLGIRMKEMVDRGQVVVHSPFFVTRVGEAGGGLCLEGETAEGTVQLEVDEIITATGARPDLSFLREVRLNLDPAVEATPALAPLIDPNIHSCGTVRPHGEAELRQPEQDFYIVGMKSYGRAPTFLLVTGYEQVRSVTAALVGDMEGAAQVQLELPETGVCGVPSYDANAVEGAACCGPVPDAALENVILPVAGAAEACCGPALVTLPEPIAAAAEACCSPADVDSGACCSPATTVAEAEPCCTPAQKATGLLKPELAGETVNGSGCC